MSDNDTPTTPTPPTAIGVVPDIDRGPTAKPVPPVPVGRTWSPEVIDLRGLDSLAAPPPPAPAVKVRVERHVSPLASMTEQQKMRLYIRVLCELVAYGESEDDDPEPEPSLIA